MPADTAAEFGDALVAQMDAALDEHQGNVQCNLCMCFHPALESKLKHKRWICKHCQNTQQMLYRHLGSSDTKALGISTQDQEEFFQTAQQTANLGEAARWKTLRTLLVEKKTATVMQQKSVNVGGAYQPMAVWERLGWDEPLVRSYNDYELAPNGTKLWRVPIKEVSSAEVRREVEETMALREKEVRKKKQLPPPRAKGKAKAAAVAPPKEEEPACVFEIASDSDDGHKSKKARWDYSTKKIFLCQTKPAYSFDCHVFSQEMHNIHTGHISFLALLNL